MRRLVLADAAIRDFGDIAGFITRESGSVPTARRFIQFLRARCMDLARLPGTLGVARPGLGDGVRLGFHGNYVILFRYEPGTLRILRVVEGHRDIGRNLLPPEA